MRISTHAPLTGCDIVRFTKAVKRNISTHAPLTGCDLLPPSLAKLVPYFNPRTPHGVRLPSAGPGCLRRDFNPRTPHGVRPHQRRGHPRGRVISTHAPLTGCDSMNFVIAFFLLIFQPTHPSRGATGNKVIRIMQSVFQPTHPSRGATRTSSCALFRIRYFNPRTPHGVRREYLVVGVNTITISTHAPLTGCDLDTSVFGPNDNISTHAPLTGCD